MNNKLSGIIFLLFGIGLLGDSAYDLYHNPVSIDFKTLKSVLLLGLAISSCIYGYKQIKNDDKIKKEDNV